MKCAAISDTHGLHRSFPPEGLQGDLIVHAGDVSRRGKEHEILDFVEWFSGLSFTHKVFIGGNHDYFLEYKAEKIKKQLPAGTHYLFNESLELEGKLIWASPLQPKFMNMAFNRVRKGAELNLNWEKIPSGCDLLLTHTPPHGILDKTHSGIQAGCEALRESLNLKKPQKHVFGHIHEAYGSLESGGTNFYNCSSLSLDYRGFNPAVFFEL